MATKPYNFVNTITSTNWQLLLSLDRFGSLDVNRSDHFIFVNEIGAYYYLPSLDLFSFQPDNAQTELEQKYAFGDMYRLVVGNQLQFGLKIGSNPIVEVAIIEFKNMGATSRFACMPHLSGLSLWFFGQATELYVRLVNPLGADDFITLHGCGTIDLPTNTDVVVYSP